MSSTSALIDAEEREIVALLDSVDLRRKRILEVGCGDGRLIQRYGEQARSIAGLEFEPGFLRSAAQEIPASLLRRVSLVRGDAVRLPFSNAAFDVAIFGWSL